MSENVFYTLLSFRQIDSIEWEDGLMSVAAASGTQSYGDVIDFIS